MRLFYLSIFVFLSFSCKEGVSSQGGGEEREMEEVFRRWQNFLDKNEFEEVRSLSTTETESLIGTIQDLSLLFPKDSTIIQTKFKEVKCIQKTDTSGICYYSVEDEELLYRDSIDLRKRGEKWLVHSPLRLDGEDTDDFFQEGFTD